MHHQRKLLSSWSILKYRANSFMKGSTVSIKTAALPCTVVQTRFQNMPHVYVHVNLGTNTVGMKTHGYMMDCAKLRKGPTLLNTLNSSSAGRIIKCSRSGIEHKPDN